MRKLFWFVFVLALFCLIYYFYMHPGVVSISYPPYTIEISVLAFSFLFLFTLFITFFITSRIQHIFQFFVRWRERKEFSQYKKIETLFIEGVVLLEEHKEKEAKAILTKFETLSEKQQSFSPLGILYQFLYTRKHPSHPVMQNILLRLQSDPVLKVLAYKTQIRHAVEQTNYELAKALCDEYLLQDAKSPWFLKVMIFLSIKLNQFKNALHFLEETHRFESPDYQLYMGSIIWYQWAKRLGPQDEHYVPYLTKSHNLNLRFAAAAARLATAFEQQGDPKRAKRVLLETWEKHPYFEIGEQFCSLGETPMEQAQLAKELFLIHPRDIMSHILLVLFYMRAELWGEARKELEKVRTKGTKPRVVKFLDAMVSHDEMGDTEQAYRILKELLESRLKVKWQCKKCKHESTTWEPFCEKCDSFDHIHYEQPETKIKIPIFPM